MSESSPKARCVPLSEDRQPPEWVLKALSGNQLDDMRTRSKWFLSLDHVDLTPAERLVLYRLWFFTSGKDTSVFTCWPSINTLARKVSLSPTSVRQALNRCESLGLLDVEHAPRKSNRYTLAWPVKPPPPRLDRLERFGKWCLATTKQGRLCHRPAGWGTDHAGNGRCRYHDESMSLPDVAGSRSDVETGSRTDGSTSPSDTECSKSSTPTESTTECQSNVVPFQREAS